MDTDVLAELIDAKRRVLVQLRELARRQKLLTGGEEGESLLRLLAVKQPLVDELTSLERRLDPFRQQDPDRRVWQSPAHRQRCATAAEQCRVLLAEVMQVERESLDVLGMRQQKTAAMLSSAGSASQAREAYLSHEPIGGSRIDLASET